jgi:16S rRNA (guanine1516-N2)-methyltransferase
VKSSTTRSERAVVTTAPSGDPAEARHIQDAYGIEAVPRDGRTVEELLEKYPGILVLGSRRADLYESGRTYRASVGMAFLRVLRARQGEIDPLVKHAGLERGDTVLDATLGLGGDALVAAQATGTKVLGIESNPVIAAFTYAALRRLPKHGREPGGRVDVVRADHRTFLEQQADASFDVVLLDPMFRRAGDAGPLFELLRTHADHAALEPATLREAQRVARRGVLVKDSVRGEDLQRLGLSPRISRRSAAIAFAWAPAAASSLQR